MSTKSILLSREHNDFGRLCLYTLSFTLVILVVCFQTSAVAAELGIDCSLSMKIQRVLLATTGRRDE